MADPATLGVIFTGIVGILGACTAGAGHLFSLRSEEAKRREARREELRGVLDAAALTLLMSLAISEHKRPTYGEAADKYVDACNAMGAQLGRIGVRVGPASRVYVAYDELRTAFLAIATAIGSMPRDQMPPPHTNPARWFTGDAQVRVAAAMQDVESGIEPFLSEAAKLAGALGERPGTLGASSGPLLGCPRSWLKRGCRRAAPRSPAERLRAAAGRRCRTRSWLHRAGAPRRCAGSD
jgi:hypothetical protein